MRKESMAGKAETDLRNDDVSVAHPLLVQKPSRRGTLNKMRQFKVLEKSKAVGGLEVPVDDALRLDLRHALHHLPPEPADAG